MPSTLNNFGMFALNLMEKIDPGNLGKDKNEEYTNIYFHTQIITTSNLYNDIINKIN